MINRKIALLVLLISGLLVLVGCAGKNNEAGGMSSNERISEKTSKNPIWSEDIPTEVPVSTDSEAVTVKNLGGTFIIFVKSSSDDLYTNYISLLKSEGWKVEWKKSESESFHSKGDYLLIVKENNSKEMQIDASSGESARYLLENIEGFKADAESTDTSGANAGNSDSSSEKGYQVSGNLVLEISSDNYLQDCRSFLDQVQGVLDDMNENVDKTNCSVTKMDDLRSKINYYFESLASNYEMLESGGAINLFTGELWPESEQPERLGKSMNSLKESIEGLINDFNSAYKYK
ncbi:MAG TPA: hypothetical protein PLP30_08320 [Clostridia bacterium]|nr:hypothetical protein [Clostridia bacterium]HPQ47358.1 hypothetical protein [Clostridia bacterium]